MDYEEVKANIDLNLKIFLLPTSTIFRSFYSSLVGRNTHISWSEIPIFHQDILSFLHNSIEKTKKPKNKIKRETLARICFTCNGIGWMKGVRLLDYWAKYLLADVCLLHSLVRHETKVNVWEVGPLTQSKQNGFVKGPHTVDKIEATTLANLVKKKNACKNKKYVLLGDITFLAAALKASLWDISGFTDLMRWISSLQIHWRTIHILLQI